MKKRDTTKKNYQRCILPNEQFPEQHPFHPNSELNLLVARRNFSTKYDEPNNTGKDP